MRKLASLLVLIPLLLAAPVLAASLGISPSETELEVPGNSTATADFQVYYFSGDLQVSLVDIPLRVEPETIHIELSDEPVDIQLTIYGDETLGSQVYDGYVRFFGMTGETVAVAIDVKAKVTNIVEGQPITPRRDWTFPNITWYIYTIIVLAIALIVVSVIRFRRKRY